MLDFVEGRLNGDWHIHLVGIGGAGMGGIAEVLVNLGCRVSGTDVNDSAMTQRLQALGVDVQIGHSAQAIGDADVVVISSAVPDSNPEVRSARERRIPLIPRAEMLAELMRFRHGVAVAGTHGKTTTTSMIASVLADSGLDPTFVIGGLLNSVGAHARLGASEYLVAEADESDGSFLLLQPRIGVVTNIDRDHLSNYGGDFDRVREAFSTFIRRLPFYGRAVLCMDDAELRALLPQVSKPFTTYGFHPEADFRCHSVVERGLASEFSIAHGDNDEWVRATLHLPGRHNVLNAVAAAVVAHELGVTQETIVSGLARFAGIGRRFQVCGDLSVGSRRVTLVDDYAHHPTELRATLLAARSAFPGRRQLVIFQPHRYSRTDELFEDFVEVLGEVEVLILAEVYPAGEAYIARADSRSLARSIRLRGRTEPILLRDLESVTDLLEDVCEHGDVVLTLGAGSVGGVAPSLLARFARQPRLRGIG